MALNSLEIATEGLIRAGGRNSLTLATEGLIRVGAAAYEQIFKPIFNVLFPPLFDPNEPPAHEKIWPYEDETP